MPPPNEDDFESDLSASPDRHVDGRPRRRARPLERLDERARVLRLIQLLFRRDMVHQGLSLREAAHRAGISLSSFHYALDPDRITESAMRPKRHIRHATLLQLREIPWLRPRTMRVLDGLIGASARRGSVRR